MTYDLTFLESAQKEWNKLAPDIQKQFKSKLAQRLITPHIPKDKLAGMRDCYKIKLKNVGYRLVYKIIESRVVIQIVAVGNRGRT
jgi:mRNA interferase RelE/StbE